jgi:ATP-dependent Lhr-like helicase
VPPAASGRWYLVHDLIHARPEPTTAAAARVDQLLERHGILTRPGTLAEGVPGGFAGLYPVLSALEEAGRVRRGYFVEGLGGSQFALPGALDRLRAGGTVGPVLLAAADPANPYGAALPWPEHPAARPSRSAGAYVVLSDGDPAAFLERGGRSVHTYTSDPGGLDEVAAALAGLATRRTDRRAVATVDGDPADSTPLGEALRAHGFVASYRGLTLPRR